MQFGAYRKILEGEHAITDLVTGVVKFRESYQYFLNSRTDDGGSADRKLYLDMAFRHEMIHIVQAITVASVFNMAEGIRFILGQLIKYRMQGAQWMDMLPQARIEYSNIKRAFEVGRETDIRESHGEMKIAVQQLFEDMAIVQTIMSMWVSPEQQLTQIIDSTPSDARYGRTLGILLRKLGPSGGLKLASTIYYVCLNCGDPQAVFGYLVNTLYEYPYSFLDSLGEGEALDFLVQLLELDTSETLVARFARSERCSIAPLWNYIGIEFATSGPINVVQRIAANPSAILAESNWSKMLDTSKIAAATPPLTLWADGVGTISSAVQDGVAENMFNAMSIHGAIERLLDKSDRPVFCQVRDCPVRKSRLCHSHYPPSKDSNWQDCSFLSLAQATFGCEPIELSDFVDSTWGNQAG